MAPSSAHNQYLQTKVLTASKEQLVLMLYDGAIRFCEQGKKGWRENNLEASHKALIRAQDILLELSCSLDKAQGGELAENMGGLYNYCYRQLITANLEHEDGPVDEVIKIIRDLREAWAQAMDSVGASTEASPEKVSLSTQKVVAMPQTQGAVPAAAPVPAPAGNAVPIARIPIAKVPADQAITPESRPRLSVQG